MLTQIVYSPDSFIRWASRYSLGSFADRLVPPAVVAGGSVSWIVLPRTG